MEMNILNQLIKCFISAGEKNIKIIGQYVENIHEIYCLKKQFNTDFLEIVQRKQSNKFTLEYDNLRCKSSLNEIV